MYFLLAFFFGSILFFAIAVLGTSLGFRSKLIFLIPPFNALVDILIGTIGFEDPVLGQLRGGLLLVYVVAMIPFLKRKGPTKPVLVWLIYLIPLLFFSSNFSFSLYTYVKMAMGYMMLPIGYALIRDSESFNRMCLSIASAAYIYVVGFFVFQIFNLGAAIYLENGFRSFGDGQGVFTQIFVYAIILFPLTLQLNKNFKWKNLQILGHALAALIVVLIYHRSSIFAMVLGLLMLGIAGYNRKKIFQYVGTAVVIAFIVVQFVAPSLYQNLVDVSKARDITLQSVVESEGGRGAEVRFFLETYSQSSIPKLFFGQELFNGGELFKWVKYNGKLRPLHVDYIIVFLGSGLIGFLLYLNIFAWCTYLVYKMKKYLPPDIKKGAWATYLGVLVACLFMSLSNQIWQISSLCVVYLYIGGFIGYATGERDRLVENSYDHYS